MLSVLEDYGSGPMDGILGPERPTPEAPRGLRGLPSRLTIGVRRLAAGLGVQPPSADVAQPPRSRALGAVPLADGTNFALFSTSASAVSVVLMGADGKAVREYGLRPEANDIWAGFVPGVGAGQRYMFRVDGPDQPAAGIRHDARRLLLDPRARALDGPEIVDAGPGGDTVLGPTSVVVAHDFDWSGDRKLNIPLADTVIYEAHVRGMTRRHPGIDPAVQGSYAALGSPTVTNHLRRLGVTAVELLPVQAFLSRRYLLDMQRVQYWGYDTIGFFAPAQGYASTPGPVAQVNEFKSMVRNLHKAGIEVILDVVYNHTPEGGPGDPMVCFRGIDNQTYYVLDPNDAARYSDVTGCGNTLNLANPETLKLVLDSLRYWATEMHVDGFRFDVAPALARRNGTFDQWSAFFAGLHADPVLSDLKIIAEPWDLGQSPYQLGNFPPGWSEWNGRFRDTVRDFWRGVPGVADLATRLAGSEDLFGRHRRGPRASVNFVTCHDGFTLADVVAYNAKHNLANGEDERDGVDDNRSWNRGVEGPTSDPAVLARRRRAQRNMLATLFLSQGVPMLLGGDEIGRSQGGNNNAYNQDNETSWYDWNAADADLLAFTERCSALRAAHPSLRRTNFLRDGDCAWLRADAQPMTADDWTDDARQSLGLFLDGSRTGRVTPSGVPVPDDDLLILLHGAAGDVTWTTPAGGTWDVILDTAAPTEAEAVRRVAGGRSLLVSGASVVVLRRTANS